MHFKRIIFLHPFFLAIFTAFSISFNFAIPKDIIIGFLVLATIFINLRSVFSNDAILNIGGLKFFKKFTAVSSKGELKQIILFFFASANIFLCHDQGV